MMRKLKVEKNRYKENLRMSSEASKYRENLKLYQENQMILKNLTDIAKKEPFSRNDDKRKVQ
jgi:hypothetical protein